MGEMAWLRPGAVDLRQLAGITMKCTWVTRCGRVLASLMFVHRMLIPMAFLNTPSDGGDHEGAGHRGRAHHWLPL